MKKFANDLIGSRILIFHDSFEAGKVEGLIIDPDNGTFLGIKFIFEKKIRVIPVSEIMTFGPSFVVAKDAKSISEIDDVIKIEKAMSVNVNIISEKVETESGQKLGKVSNYTIDLSKMSLDKIFVSPGISINFIANDLIISFVNILEITPKKIIVNDSFAKVKKPLINIAPSPVVE